MQALVSQRLRWSAMASAVTHLYAHGQHIAWLMYLPHASRTGQTAVAEGMQSYVRAGKVSELAADVIETSSRCRSPCRPAGY